MIDFPNIYNVYDLSEKSLLELMQKIVGNNVKSVALEQTGELVITLNNGEVINLGKNFLTDESVTFEKLQEAVRAAVQDSKIKLEQYVNILNVGVNSVKSGDSALTVVTKINNILALYDYVIIPAGTYAINGTINMNYGGKKILIIDGATITNSSDTPSILVSGSKNEVIGLNGATIKHTVSTPNGVIKISNNNTFYAFYNKVSGLTIMGITDSAVESVGLNFYTDNSFAFQSYYNNVANMLISTFNTGIKFTSQSNQNHISNIDFWNVGKNKVNGGAVIYFVGDNAALGKSPIENNLVNLRHNGGAENPTLIKGVGMASMNNIEFIYEPGGVTQLFDVDGTLFTKNFIKLVGLNTGGFGATPELMKNNVIIGDDRIYCGVLSTNTEDNIHRYAKSFKIEGTTENNLYKVLTIKRSSAQNTHQMVDCEISILSLGGSLFSSATNIKVTAHFASGSNRISQCNVSGETNVVMPVMDADTLVILFKPKNNGTAGITNLTVNYNIRYGNAGSSILSAKPTIEEFTTPTIYGTTVNSYSKIRQPNVFYNGVEPVVPVTGDMWINAGVVKIFITSWVTITTT